MARIEFDHVTKIFPNGATAVRDLVLSVEDGEFMILVGPSGCGKTTALRMVAGLESVSAGEIRIGERRVNELEPPDRDIAMVFQNYALYPHMTVQDNIGFPLLMQGLPKREIQARSREAASILGIEELLVRKPGELSGGQRQRVAMGRAVVRHPRAFLMDEPLSNLDAKLRVQMRAELVKLHRRLGVTTLYVTHDQTEAMTLGQRVAVMNLGVMQQVDAPHRLYARPVNTFVASFIGSPAMNFLRGRIDGRTLEVGEHHVPLPDQVLARAEGAHGRILVGFRPEHLRPRALGTGDGLAFPAEVEITEQLGPEALVYLRVPDMEVAEIGDRPVELRGVLVARLDPLEAPEAGAMVQMVPDLRYMHVFDEETGASLLA